VTRYTYLANKRPRALRVHPFRSTGDSPVSSSPLTLGVAPLASHALLSHSSLPRIVERWSRLTHHNHRMTSSSMEHSPTMPTLAHFVVLKDAANVQNLGGGCWCRGHRPGMRQFRQRVMVLILRLVHLYRGEDFNESDKKEKRNWRTFVNYQLLRSSTILRQAIYFISAVPVIVSLAVEVPMQERKGLISFTVDKDADVGGERMLLWVLVEGWIGMETRHVLFYP